MTLPASRGPLPLLTCLLALAFTCGPAMGEQDMTALEEPVAIVVPHEGAALRGQIVAWGDAGLQLRPNDGSEPVTLQWNDLPARHVAGIHARILRADATAEDQLRLARRLSPIDDADTQRLMQQAIRRAIRMDESLEAEAKAILAEHRASLASDAPAPDPSPDADPDAADDREPESPTPERLRWPELTEQDHQQAIEELTDHARRAAEQLDVPFTLYESEFFLFATDMGRDEARFWYEMLDDMYRTLLRTFGQPSDENIWRGKALVLAFDNRDGYRRYYQEIHNRPAGSAVGRCHYLPSGNVYITLFRHSEDRLRVAGTLVHEAAHGFAYRYRSRASLPSWVNEGLADWAKYELVPQLRQSPNVYERARRQIQQRGSLEGMFLEDQIEGWQYPIAFTLTEFMVDQGRGRYVDFFHAIKDGVEWEEALEEHYGVPLDRLLHAYAASLRVDTPTP